MNILLANTQLHKSNPYDTIKAIGLVVSALNRIELTNVSFTCRGQADIYKNNIHDTPLFVAMSRNYQVCYEYIRYGGVVNIEGNGNGHVVFFKNVMGYDISGLSSVPTAKELITLPQVIKYHNEHIFTTSKSISYYFATLQSSQFYDTPLIYI